MTRSNRPMAEPFRVARLVVAEWIESALDPEGSHESAEDNPFASDLSPEEMRVYLAALKRIGERLKRETMRGWRTP